MKLAEVLCCPIVPNRVISKLAFDPPSPSYNFKKHSKKKGKRIVWLNKDAELNGADTKHVIPCTTHDPKGEKVACAYIRCCSNPQFVVFYAHNNGSDLGYCIGPLLELGKSINCDMFTFDYSGYGISSGKPSEKKLYENTENAFQLLKKKFNLKNCQIIAYGQSIGTAAITDVCTRHKVAGVILHSPMLSGYRVFFSSLTKTHPLDPFQSITKVKHIQSPILVMHGKKDAVIPFRHGQTLYEKCAITVAPLWIDEGKHNNLEAFPQYIERLLLFVAEDIPVKKKLYPRLL